MSDSGAVAAADGAGLVEGAVVVEDGGADEVVHAAGTAADASGMEGAASVAGARFGMHSPPSFGDGVEAAPQLENVTQHEERRTKWLWLWEAGPLVMGMETT